MDGGMRPEVQHRACPIHEGLCPELPRISQKTLVTRHEVFCTDDEEEKDEIGNAEPSEEEGSRK